MPRTPGSPSFPATPPRAARRSGPPSRDPPPDDSGIPARRAWLHDLTSGLSALAGLAILLPLCRRRDAPLVFWVLGALLITSGVADFIDDAGVPAIAHLVAAAVAVSVTQAIARALPRKQAEDMRAYGVSTNA